MPDYLWDDEKEIERTIQFLRKPDRAFFYHVFLFFFKKGLENQKRSNYNKDRKVKYSQSQKEVGAYDVPSM